jgi:hypothetical protein
MPDDLTLLALLLSPDGVSIVEIDEAPPTLTGSRHSMGAFFRPAPRVYTFGRLAAHPDFEDHNTAVFSYERRDCD